MSAEKGIACESMAGVDGGETKPSVVLEKEDELERVFRRFDANGDGRISASELSDVLRALGSEASQEELAQMMAEMDSDHDGFVDFREFADFHRGSRGRNDRADAGELRDAFEVYDVDRNGLISARELHMVMKRLGESCSFEDCTRMIASVDADGDGNVNFEEFKRMMTNKPGGSVASTPAKTPSPSPSPR